VVEQLRENKNERFKLKMNFLKKLAIGIALLICLGVKAQKISDFPNVTTNPPSSWLLLVSQEDVTNWNWTLGQLSNYIATVVPVKADTLTTNFVANPPNDSYILGVVGGVPAFVLAGTNQTIVQSLITNTLFNTYLTTNVFQTFYISTNFVNYNYSTNVISTTVYATTNVVDYFNVNTNTFITFLTDVYFSGKSYLNLTVATNLPGTGYGFKTLTTPTSQGTNFTIDGSQATYFDIKLTNNFNLSFVTNSSTIGAGGLSCSIKFRPNGADRVLTISTNVALLDTNNWAQAGSLWQTTITNASDGNGPRVGWLSLSCNDPTYAQSNVTAIFKLSP
jgi:hypothetical protein